MHLELYELVYSYIFSAYFLTFSVVVIYKIQNIVQ